MHAARYGKKIREKKDADTSKKDADIPKKDADIHARTPCVGSVCLIGSDLLARATQKKTPTREKRRRHEKKRRRHARSDPLCMHAASIWEKIRKRR
jgi:hypothetical protein